ncbi:MAG: hypothetical protein JEZ02_12380 [Desulfatibacillum sp.]|nr:hypothetical protein [Desulfatibacillum sp.]
MGILEKFRLTMGAGDHKAFSLISLTAPLYFLLFALTRSYWETGLMGHYPMFSYYRGIHHVLWITTAALALIMALQAYTGTEPRKLMFMLFGVTFMAVPVLHSLITGVPLELTYIHGNFKTIVRDIATFCLLNPQNRPLSLEMMMLVGGIGLLAYLITGSKLRGLGAFATSYLVGILVAIHWMGLPSMPGAVFNMQTEFSIHPFQAVVYSHWAMGIVLFAAIKQGLFEKDWRAWIRSFGWGAVAWLFYALAASAAGWFSTTFDCLATGLPLFTAITMAVRVHQEPWRKRGTVAALGLLSVLLLFQLLVMGPIYLGIHEQLTGPGTVRWTLSPMPG